MRVLSSSGPFVDLDSRKLAQPNFPRLLVFTGGQGVVSVPDELPCSGPIHVVQRKEARSSWRGGYRVC